jgi:hypothetical protein
VNVPWLWSIQGMQGITRLWLHVVQGQLIIALQPLWRCFCWDGLGDQWNWGRVRREDIVNICCFGTVVATSRNISASGHRKSYQLTSSINVKRVRNLVAGTHWSETETICCHWLNPNATRIFCRICLRFLTGCSCSKMNTLQRYSVLWIQTLELLLQRR